MMLDELKTLFEIELTDNSKDAILNLYIKRATALVQNHLNFTDEEMVNLDDSIVAYAEYLYRNKGKENITQETQAKRSTTYATNIPAFITQMLPLPHAKFISVNQNV